MLWLWLHGCVVKHPPPLFTDPPQEVGAPPPVEPFAGSVDACPEQLELVPGVPLPASVVAVEGSEAVPACRGQLVPEAELVALWRAEDDGIWWRDRARSVYLGRLADREYAETITAARHGELHALRREVRVLRWQGVAGFTLAGLVGLAAGTGLGLAAGRAGVVVVPAVGSSPSPSARPARR